MHQVLTWEVAVYELDIIDGYISIHTERSVGLEDNLKTIFSHLYNNYFFQFHK